MVLRLKPFNENLPMESGRAKKSIVQVDASFSSEEMAPAIVNTAQLTLRYPKDNQHLILATWAIILRSYSSNDLVTFQSSSFEATQQNGTEAGDSDNWALKDRCVLQYEFRDDIAVHQLHPTQLRISNKELCDKHTAASLNFKGERHASSVLLLQSTIGSGPFLDIWVILNESKESFRVILRHSSLTCNNLFTSTILSNLVHIWDCIEAPSQLVKDLSLIGPESIQLLQSWNPQNLLYQSSCMHHLVEAISRALPDKEAVCAWDGTLTHQQLDVFASQTAKSLIDLGVQRGEFVPFVFEKSMWTVVAVLGILKAGAAFVPLEPTYPRSRLRNIIAITKAEVIVSSDLWRPLCLDLVRNVCVVSKDTVNPTQNISTYQLASVSSSPNDPMLVFFTSGSTGKPKGMVHEHAGICTHAIAHGEIMSYRGSRVLQFSAHTFDVAVIDMFTTLLFGGCVCIPSEDERRTDLTGAVARLQADHLFLTPSFAALIEPLDVPTVRTLVTGGEVLPQSLFDRWAKAVDLIQVYGPAEVGICLLTQMKAKEKQARNVGYTLPNCSCWLVEPNDYNRLVPIGAVGELIVASSSLARGYLGDEAKTKEVFLEPPAWAKDLGLLHQRFYRTGDLLVHNLTDLDGSFIFVGRKDDQIKLRGQRLEPAEVEKHILAFSQVAMVVVTTVDSGVLAGELVAVVQLRGEDESRLNSDLIVVVTTPADLFSKIQDNLSRNLPAFMVPSQFLVIKKMPRVPAQKIDRPAVKRWLQSLSAPSDEMILPFHRHLDCTSVLEPHETTAIEISTKVVSMLPLSQRQSKIFSGQDISIHNVGLNSARIISLSYFLRRRFQIVIKADILWDPEITVRRLASFVHNCQSFDESVGHQINLRAIVERHRAQLLARLKRTPLNPLSSAPKRQRYILLTGATGYLGIGILKHLIVNTSSIVYLLVRGESTLDAMERMNKIMINLEWWQESFMARIHVWRSDISKDDLWLEHDVMQVIRGDSGGTLPSIDTVIHSAAHVNYNANFSALVGPNVKSTVSLLEIAASSHSIRNVVFITGGRAPDVNIPSFEESCSALQELGGYAQTKFIAEEVMICAASSPSFKYKHLSVLRPGYIIGAVNDGKANRIDFIWRLIACCIETHGYNKEATELWLFVAGVDQVADQVVRLALNEGNSTNVSNFRYDQVLTGIRFRDLWNLLSDIFGYILVGKTADAWIDDIKNTVFEAGEDHYMYPLLHTLEDEGTKLGTTLVPEAMYELDREVVCQNVRYLIYVGFLPHPPAWANT